MLRVAYIMPPIPPMPWSWPPMPAGSFFSSGRSVTVTSVVSINPATLDAFCKAHRVTLVGSMTPAFHPWHILIVPSVCS